MNYYPIMIPTLNRHEHFIRCVESLSKNTHANQTELIIGLDYPPSEKDFEGYKKIKAYIPSISGFKKVTLFERTENLGPDKNWAELQRYAFENYDAVICSEDDNEFSPCFLDYMNKMLEFYKDNPVVSSVSGYFPNYQINNQGYQVYFARETNAWGMGLWKKKETGENNNPETVKKIIRSFGLSCKSFWTYPFGFNIALRMAMEGQRWGDVTRTQCNIYNNKFQVRPNFSLCRNWGFDSTGLHCNNDDSFKNQEISDGDVYNFDGQDVGYPTLSKKQSWSSLRPKILAGEIKFLLSTIVLYIRVRINEGSV